MTLCASHRRRQVAGLGKTTLAHVVAAHCGYRPVEINASDDRSGAALHTRITDACQMQAVLGSKQPNCVIIDEIDGAIGSFLLASLDVLQAIRRIYACPIRFLDASVSYCTSYASQ